MSTDLTAALPARGREYVTWTVEGLPDGVAVSASFDRGVTWHGLERVAGGVRALVAGPDAPPDADAVRLDAGDVRVLLRVVDTPEVVERAGGTIHVYGG